MLKAVERVVKLSARGGKLKISTEGAYNVKQVIEAITVMGINTFSGRIYVHGFDGDEKLDLAWEEDIETLRISELEVRLDEEGSVAW